MPCFRGESCIILIPFKLSLGVTISSGLSVCYRELLPSEIPPPCNIFRSTVTFVLFLAAGSLSNSSFFYRPSLATMTPPESLCGLPVTMIFTCGTIVTAESYYGTSGGVYGFTMGKVPFFSLALPSTMFWY